MSPSPWPAASKELRQFPGDQRLPRAGGAMQQHAPHVADAQVPDHVWREDPGRKRAPEDVAKLPWWHGMAWWQREWTQGTKNHPNKCGSGSLKMGDLRVVRL